MARSRLTLHLAAFVLGLATVLAEPWSGLAQAPPQRIGAVVNDDVITSQDLLDRLELALVTSGLPPTQESRQRLAPQVMRGMIDEKLQLQEAERLGLPVTEAEIDQALDTIAARNNTDRANLLRYLEASRINPGTLRDQLRAQIAWIKVVGREIRPKIVVTQEQIEYAVRRAAADSGTEVLLSEILLPVYDRGQEATVTAQAAELVKSLRAGADFAALAGQVSAAASAERGGDLGWVRIASLAPDLRGPIAALQPGQVSDPLPGPNGVRILRVRDRRQSQAEPVDRERVRQRLEQEQLERQAARYLRDLRRDAYIDIRL